MTASEDAESEDREIELFDGTKTGPENDSVNLQCINSSDFVVGKQTTFNGPVTIINYPESSREEVDGPGKTPKEEIIIKERVITPSAVTEIEASATKKSGNSRQQISLLRRVACARFFKVPVALWILLIIVVNTAALALLLGNNTSIGPETKPMTIPYNGREYNFFTRKDWHARPPLSRVEMKIPVEYVVISHTASRFCYYKADCMTLIRDIQGDAMNQYPPYADIPYSFMVGGDGNIYEGRGWTTRNAVVGFANAKNVNINFVGSFENFDPPTYPQTEAVRALIEYGVNHTYIDVNYKLISANATYSTLSPGVQVYKEIKNWPHFEPDPKSKLINSTAE